jgi:tetratricopeptide (TPR) repeat protein
MSSARYIAWLLAASLTASVALPVALSALGGEGFQRAVAADEKKPSQRPKKTRRIPTMSERTFKRLAEVQEAIDLKDLLLAHKLLRDMEGRKGMNGNELGQIYNMQAYVYFSQEDYEGAIRSYEKVVAQGDQVPEGLEVGTIYSLAQLYFVTEHYQKALDSMQLWLSKADNPGPDPHIFMGQVYYQMKDYRNAIPQIQKGISIAQERGTLVRENWWQLLRYLYYEQENNPKVIEILEILVEDFPKREYWVQLAGMYGEEGFEKKQIYAMETAHAGGFLTKQNDLLSFSGLLMQDEVPYRSAKYLSRGMEDEIVKENSKNLQMLGQAWQLAQEVDKAIPVFQLAAKKSDDGEIYARLAQLYLEKDQYKNCVKAADSALRKGGLKKSYATHIVRGMCLFNNDRLTSARVAFVEAGRLARLKKDASNQRITRQWVRYIDGEKKRRAALAASI